jgi:hypothetical protein
MEQIKNIQQFWFFSNLLNSVKMIQYNLKIIFGNRFIYFFLAAIALMLFIIGINLFQGEMVSEDGVYSTLLLGGCLLIFYPAAFGIQNDKDGRTIEIIFGIPDYRFRVWFMRIVLVYAITMLFLIVISYMLRYVFVSFNVFEMNLQVLFPLAFLGFLAFFLSTVFRSGNATAAVMIILSLLLLIFSDEIARSMWNVFHNPFNPPSSMSEMAWYSVSTKNRLFLASGTLVFLLGALLNLQKREKLLG